MKQKVSYSEIYNLISDVLKLRLKYPELKSDEIIENIKLVCNAIDKINRTLTISMIKGIGGVINNLKLYMRINEEIMHKVQNGTSEVPKEDLLVLELLDDRIMDKVRERLYPNDTEFLSGRVGMADQLYSQAKSLFDGAVQSSDLREKLNAYGRIYIFEEDFESLTLRRVLEANGIKGFSGYVAENDSYKIDGAKIASFREAGIRDDDVVLIPSRGDLKKYDRECCEKCGVKNVMELGMFDSGPESNKNNSESETEMLEKEIEELTKLLNSEGNG